MKLQSLLERRIRMAEPGERIPRRGKRLGSEGLQGGAFEHPSEVGIVYKKADIRDIKYDPYIKFVILALKHQDNPFFPKIYDAVIYKKDPKTKNDGKSEYELVVKMERLYPIDNPKLIDAAVESFIQLGMPLSHVGSIQGQHGPSFYDYFKDEKFRKELASTTKNPQLKKALKLLEPYIKRFRSEIRFFQFYFK